MDVVRALRRSAASVVATVVAVSVAWLVLLPWNLSVIGLPGADGDLFEAEDTRVAFIVLMVLVAVWCAVFAYFDREGVVPRGIAAVATIGLWYAWRAGATGVVAADVWLSALVDIILAPATAAAFVGTVVGLALGRRRRSADADAAASLDAQGAEPPTP
jgi:hypothetical protein